MVAAVAVVAVVAVVINEDCVYISRSRLTKSWHGKRFL
ncbi:hypothetical protein cje161_04735 [Campylobacter jejuni subsp. jejuni 2008-831]|nr:hypothetical protein cje114_02016 [Campylobacter jejuni subsp. jejuni LMG 23269]EIB40989.1 hypothetical protein cje14_07063 [Campylobacter jejuni subsp. jejuni 53161]EIB56595.1 hypothetical protein cje161_04735 [Campylobacter jejuni subsp. jejuni 2008-831]EIB66609.1 hypothetical protein cje25_03391 [Campylobacter jejuni subsp. jejuni 1997-14]